MFQSLTNNLPRDTVLKRYDRYMLPIVLHNDYFILWTVHVAYCTVSKSVQHPRYMYCDALLRGLEIIHYVLLCGCASQMLNENDITSKVAVEGTFDEQLDRYAYLGKMVTRVGDLLPENKSRIALYMEGG